MDKRYLDHIIKEAAEEIAAANPASQLQLEPEEPEEAEPGAESEQPQADVQAPEDDEFDLGPDLGMDDVPEEPSAEDYPRPDYSVDNAIDTLRGLLDNWQEVRLNFPPGDPNRDQVTKLGDVLYGVALNLQKIRDKV